MTDQQLLTTFINSDDQAAFAELVRRHIDLVWGIARRQVPAHAEDIAQAVFLRLFQRARHVHRHENIAGWLFRTTLYCCKNLKRTEGRRMRHELAAGTIPFAHDGVVPPELSGLLDESLEKLPHVYREAVLVRYLEGRSITDAAKSLGVSEAAIAKRAARGLERLRAQFAQAGFNVGVAAVSSLLVAESAKAAPAQIAGNIASLASDKAFVTVKAATLAHGPAKSAVSVLPIKSATAVAGLLLVAGVITAAGYFLTGHPIQPASAMLVSAPSRPISPAPIVDETKIPGDLQIVRYDVLLDTTGTDTLRNLSHDLPAKTEFFQLRQANAAQIRAALTSLTASHHLLAPGYALHGSLPPHTKAFSWQGTQLLPSLGSGTFFLDGTAPSGDAYNLSIGETLGYAEERDGHVDFRYAFDSCRLTLRFKGDTPDLSEVLDKSAAVHWSGPLAPGEALLFIGDWGEWRNDHLGNVRIVETYKASPAQVPYVNTVEYAQWINAGPTGAREIADRALIWAANGDNKWLDGKDKWTRRLSDGTVVRLLGIARPKQWQFCWWNPDGIPTAQHFADDYGVPTATLAAAVKIIQPALTLHGDPRVWRDGVTIAIPQDDKHLDVYVGTGPWTEQPIRPREQVLVGDAGYVHMDKPTGGRNGQTYANLQGHLSPDLEVRLAAVTKEGLHLSGNLRDDAGQLVTSEIPMWKWDHYFFAADPDEIDHYVLLSRKREQVTFDGFADNPAIQPPATPVPAEARHAEEIVAHMDPEPDAWSDLWNAKKLEFARLDALPRDPQSAVGSMRIMVDKARAGDAPAVKSFLRSSNAALATQYATALTAFGKAFDHAEKTFGREPLMHEFSKRRALLSLEATYLEPDCEFSAGAAYGYRNFVPLLQSTDRWTIDLDRITKQFPAPTIAAQCAKLIASSNALSDQLTSGAIKDPASAVDFMLNMEVDNPPLAVDWSVR